MKKTDRWVVIATSSRPWLVACGRLVKDNGHGRVRLDEARCAVYFSPPTRSVFGCATIGPQPGSRVSGACEWIVLRGVEWMAPATPAAVAAWRAEPWT
jgi:hypothetical protein